ncbi:MAG: hypothetical protein K0M58_09515 [Thiobacillus sp.]|nr:hypothetical protein [Thiobacillus sp.]
MKKYLVGMGLLLSASGAFADSAGLEQFKSMAASVKYTPPATGMMSAQATGPMLLRDAVYLYNLPIRAGWVQELYGANCDVFQLVLDVESGHTDMGYYEYQDYLYPDRIYDYHAMFAYALYSGSAEKGFILGDDQLYDAPGVNPDLIVGTATAFGYCFSTNPAAYVLHCDERASMCYTSSGTAIPW